MNRRLQWDIFCKVIDNFGDIGVCWRLAADLASRGHSVRLWVDDATALNWMASDGCAGVQLLPWSAPLQFEKAGFAQQPPDVMIEAFGCDMDPEFLAACARFDWPGGEKPVWINLEYLSAESYVERCHAMPSPVATGPASGWRKWFFYPGFTPATGGLLREADLATHQSSFDRAAWLKSQGIAWNGERLISLFCYEPPALTSLIDRLSMEGLAGEPALLLVTKGRAEPAVRAALAGRSETGKLGISWLKLLPQREFDHLLWSCDLNFVRGEDSVVRAIWAGKPFVWQIYPQDDGVHEVKLEAFLDMLQAPVSLRNFHRAWNEGALADPGKVLAQAAIELPAWESCVIAARSRLAGHNDLVTSLVDFVAKNR